MKLLFWHSGNELQTTFTKKSVNFPYEICFFFSVSQHSISPLKNEAHFVSHSVSVCLTENANSIASLRSWVYTFVYISQPLNATKSSGKRLKWLIETEACGIKRKIVSLALRYKRRRRRRRKYEILVLGTHFTIDIHNGCCWLNCTPFSF